MKSKGLLILLQELWCWLKTGKPTFKIALSAGRRDMTIRRGHVMRPVEAVNISTGSQMFWVEPHYTSRKAWNIPAVPQATKVPG